MQHWVAESIYKSDSVSNIRFHSREKTLNESPSASRSTYSKPFRIPSLVSYHPTYLLCSMLLVHDKCSSGTVYLCRNSCSNSVLALKK